MATSTQKKDAIINAHTHIFTGEYVPPFIAKKVLPWPFYFLIHLPTILRIFKWYLKKQQKRYDYESTYSRYGRFRTRFNILLRDNFLLNLLWKAVGLLLTLQALYVLYDLLSRIQRPKGSVADWIEQGRRFLHQYYLLRDLPGWLDALIVTLVILFFKSGRNLIFFIFKNIWKFFSKLPGKQTKELANRYILMGRFAIHDKQWKIKNQLTAQYNPGSGFVLLPMDMKYMNAGRFDSRLYHKQMEELIAIKKREKDNDMYPFVFIDPRRMREEGKKFFDYTVQEGKVVLANDCFVKKYIEDEKFSGFKIYPALGYYPFEEELLPLWKYAVDNDIPIMTHCVKGVIYYRGNKEKQWDKHPVFKEKRAKDDFVALKLPESRNEDFTGNFTNPMNYLCLLSEPLLSQLVADAKDERIKELFGFQTAEKTMKHNLERLKVCLAHFGGEPEWEKYLEADRYNFAQSLIRHRGRGIDMAPDPVKGLKWGLYEQLWKYVDWYSLICSLALQFDNVYTDISFIISKPQIYPLLRETLSKELNPELRKKVLYGTDFYVVRNLKSDKNIVTETRFGLEEEDFDQIARVNTRAYLARKFADSSAEGTA